MVKIAVAGCGGRMGRRISDIASSMSGCKLTGGFEIKENPLVGKNMGEIGVKKGKDIVIADSLEKIIDMCDVVIDFTSPKGTVANVKTVLRYKKRIVIGTTGLSPSDERVIKNASEKIPIVYAPNMSVGVNLMFKLTKMVASILDESYDIEIVEAHHCHKKDAPSGTALELARRAASGRGVDLKKKAVFGRYGFCGERKKGEIGVHAVRGGDIVGEHNVSFITSGERIELVHKASSRDAFAKGAVIAAKFLSKKKKGLYNMQDVLGLA